MGVLGAGSKGEGATRGVFEEQGKENITDVDYKENPRKHTQEEREQYFKEGLCLHCQKEEHLASACPIFSNSPALLT